MKDMELKKEINILLWLRFPFWVPTCTRSYTPRGCKPFSSRQVGSSDSVCVLWRNHFYGFHHILTYLLIWTHW